MRPSPNFVCLVPMAMAWPSSGGVAICYVLPVLWITSYSHMDYVWRYVDTVAASDFIGCGAQANAPAASY